MSKQETPSVPKENEEPAAKIQIQIQILLIRILRTILRMAVVGIFSVYDDVVGRILLVDKGEVARARGLDILVALTVVMLVELVVMLVELVVMLVVQLVVKLGLIVNNHEELAPMERRDVASKAINSRGGVIYLRHYGISLTIPDSAVQKDCKITIKVLSCPSGLFPTKNEVLVSPGVVCEPSGTTFKKPLKLVIPHCAVLTDPSKAEVTMYFTEGDGKVRKKQLSSTGTPRCIIRKYNLEVYINHFSFWEVFMVISEFFIGKRVASTPYLPQPMKRLEPQYCHLRLYNDNPGLDALIEAEERRLDYHKMAPTKKMFVHWSKGKLKIICEVEGGHIPENEKMKTVSLDDIYRLDQNVLSFLVEVTSKAQARVKFIFHPHSDEGQAFLVKLSAEPSPVIEASTSPKTSASKPVGVPLQGASAAAGEVSTSTARNVSDEMLNNLAKHVPTNAYDKFCKKLGIEYNHARGILEKYRNDYEKATRECTAIWKDKSSPTVADLHKVLRAADLKGLVDYCT